MDQSNNGPYNYHVLFFRLDFITYQGKQISTCDLFQQAVLLTTCITKQMNNNNYKKAQPKTKVKLRYSALFSQGIDLAHIHTVTLTVYYAKQCNWFSGLGRKNGGKTGWSGWCVTVCTPPPPPPPPKKKKKKPTQTSIFHPNPFAFGYKLVKLQVSSPFSTKNHPPVTQKC